ncbi:hypothetical protein SAMN04487948_12555 [Halogranum amylolyticum]|uniref:Uncharacterized protein n=1 Tax=Halogranum amylolyticum TaxID=660520 RepID=A0A1H8W8U3_9EURY|nr:hypothetical protein [Halogranum amylolyticum]SEP24086.1 hypothetical protein SAMN04487948_12555 [Halogranum amylolyticum]
MPSRRRLLAAISSVAVAGMAGCSGSASGGSDTVDCHTSALVHGRGNVLDNGARGTVEEGDVRLAVPLSVDNVREYSISVLKVYDAAGNLVHAIPESADDAELMANKAGVNEGQLLYEQSIGRRPFHGRYRVDAVNTSEESVDFVTIEFNCFSDVSD